MAFSTMNGDLDITFSKGLKADIKVKTQRGDIYTGFEFVEQNNDALIEKEKIGESYKVKVEKWVQGKINGGGAEILFKNFNGDIIIRSEE